jgi:hypothetical protein
MGLRLSLALFADFKIAEHLEGQAFYNLSDTLPVRGANQVGSARRIYLASLAQPERHCWHVPSVLRAN